MSNSSMDGMVHYSTITNGKPLRTVIDHLELFWFKIVKFNLYIIKARYNNSLFYNIFDLTKCVDYNRYRKMYKLLYGV